jgi:hypothetical protein
MAERWWVQARVERSGLSHDVGLRGQDRQSALVAFFPSEFSGFRLEYDHTSQDHVARADHALALQYNVTIGAHPAHSY